MAAITYKGESLIATKQANGEVMNIDRIILANIPGLDPSKPVDRNEQLPPAEHIVLDDPVSQHGYINPNLVVYALHMGTGGDPFEFNWLGLYCSEDDTVIAINYMPTQGKDPSLAMTRNLMLEFSGAQETGDIHVPAESWMVDFSQRMDGTDGRSRQMTQDVFGRQLFYGDACKVVKGSGGYYDLLPGEGYVAGIRFNYPGKSVLVSDTPTSIWLDVSQQGNAMSDIQPVVEVVVSANDQTDYQDSAGVWHFLEKIAQIDSLGSVYDIRISRKGYITDELNQSVTHTSFEEAMNDTNTSADYIRVGNRAMAEYKKLPKDSSVPKGGGIDRAGNVWELNAKTSRVEYFENEENPLQAAFDYAYDKDIEVELEPSTTYNIEKNVVLKRPLKKARAAWFRGPDIPGDGDPLISFIVQRGVDLSGFRFRNVNLVFDDSDAILYGCAISDSILIDCTISGFNTRKFNNGLTIQRNIFERSRSRNLHAIDICNISNVDISGNTFQEYQNAINIKSNLSTSTHTITIEGNTAMGCSRLAMLQGASYARISNVSIKRNTVSGSWRDSGPLKGQVQGYFVSDVTIENNTLSCSHTPILFYSSYDVRVLYNELTSINDGSGFRFIGCNQTRVKGNDVRTFIGGYAGGLVLGGINHFYNSENTEIERNTIYVSSENVGGLKIEDTLRAKIEWNEFRSADGKPFSHSSGLCWFDGESNGVFTRNSAYFPQLGTILQDTSSGDISTTPSDNSNTVIPEGETAVEEVFVGSDNDFLGSRSYIYRIKISDLNRVKGDVTDSPELKTISEFMSDKPNAVLAINASGFYVNNQVPPIVVNGVIQENYGVNYNSRAMSNQVVIDKAGRLSCRAIYSAMAPRVTNATAILLQEGAWQTAAFSTPLIIDKELFDYTILENISEDYFEVDRHPRMAIGQSRDGWFYIIAVDGRFEDSPGATCLELANKFISLGCENAFNLDGGGSTTLWVNGEVVNRPSDGEERPVPHAMYFEG